MDVAGLKNYDGAHKTLKQYDSDYSRYPFNAVNQYSQIGIDIDRIILFLKSQN